MDILFFPYIKVFRISVSMILIPAWCIFNAKKIKLNNELLLILVFAVLSLLSVLFSLIRYPNYSSQNIFSLLMLLFGILIYIFVSINQDFIYINIKKFLKAYIIFIFVLSVVYYISPSIYFNVRLFWSLSDNVSVTDTLLLSRFTGTLSDPNNMATVINAVFIYIIINYKEKSTLNFIFLIMVGFITVATLSLTGIIIYSISVTIYLLNNFSNLVYNFRNIKINIFTVLILIVIIIPILFFLSDVFFNSELFETFIYRFSINSPESRFSRWEVVIENKSLISSLFFGDGGTMIINGDSFRPHNGHFHLIFNYGLIAYIIFMWLFFRIRTNINFIKYWYFLIPFFIGFTVNVGIIDFRFYTMLALLTANYYSSFKESYSYYKH